MEHSWITVEGNEAVARIAYLLSEVIAIYPITPSTPMGECADAWSAAEQKNMWETVPLIIEMQSEGGVAGALHGALQTGALATTFTASQGLLLMIPNMYKIAGELTPMVMHVAARTLATHALSIFGDHSDVMATRATGFALLASNSVQEAQDLALIAHLATLKARIPFLHFFDGFRTSHEINKVEQISRETISPLLDDTLVRAHRARALSPEHPVIRGTAQNPDVYFQERERANPSYLACPNIVQNTMDIFASQIGRQYHLFDYMGASDAERIVVIMGSGAETVQSTVEALNKQGEKVGVVKVHLFRPFSITHFLQALPPTARTIAVLDRTKEPGSVGEPLYQDIVTAITEGQGWNGSSPLPRIIGGRYGLSSKEFTPAMVKGIFGEMEQEQPRTHFTIGITDDITHTSLPYDPTFELESAETVQCVFWGLGSDGTVGANKNSLKILGEETENHVQGYFVYDSKKSGSVTISHLRFGPHPIHAPYQIAERQAHFVACHQFSMLERFDVLKYARPGGTFLLDSPYGPEEVWNHLPSEIQQTIREQQLHFFVINAHRVASETGMRGRINTIMQTCFFALSGILPRDQAIAYIKQSIKKTYSKRGETVVQQNWQAVDKTLEHLHEVTFDPSLALAQTQETQLSQALANSGRHRSLPMLNRRPPVEPEAPEFVRAVLGPIVAGEGDTLPVSAFPTDGTYPSGTARWEKRNMALEIPVWDPDICIQCGKCVMVCPHAVIREKIYAADDLKDAPETFVSTNAHFKEFPGQRYTLQVSPEDCTSCGLCIEACPARDKRQVGRKAIHMEALPPGREQEKANWNFFLTLPEVKRDLLNVGAIKDSQLLQPLFEFSGACAGCGETPYIKLATQLFGDHMIVANATGCSSIYGGNLPTTPWTMNREGRGPAWANSLFEDNAEFGLGMRISLDKQYEYARELLLQCAPLLEEQMVQSLLNADQTTEAGIQAQRQRIAQLQENLQEQLSTVSSSEYPVRNLLSLATALQHKSVWIIGGDGWAYDIGFGGLDHVLASGRNVNILVLDTEVYSNTGGQASKSTPRAAVAKFAARGKASAKKDLGLLAMAYGNVYVASVAMGASDQQTLRAFLEAEAYDGPSLIIAYSHCIAHGIDMDKGLTQQKLAVQTGYWPLYRYNPALASERQNPFTLDSKAPSLPLEEYAYHETRYRMLLQSNSQRAETLMQQATQDVQHRWKRYQEMAAHGQQEKKTEENHA